MDGAHSQPLCNRGVREGTSYQRFLLPDELCLTYSYCALTPRRCP